MKYDVVIIGSGPGGYVAAVRCSQLGMKTAIIEKYDVLGGTCLNVGCIPSKALLDSSEHYHNAQNKFEEHGINASSLKVNIKQMITRKNEVVSQTNSGVSFLMNKNKVDVYHGIGSFVNPTTIKVLGENETMIEADKTIIATGSKPLTPEVFNYDKNRVITSTEALNLAKIPKKMIVIGGGVIGLELGSVYARLGTEISVIEYQDSILPSMDADIGKEMRRILKRLGFKFYLGHSVTEVKGMKSKVKVKFKNKSKDEILEAEADYCLLSIGRRPYTDGLGLENIGIKTDQRGRIEVNEYLQTSVPNIYAIGDVIKGAMLAHKAEEEGIFVAEKMVGQMPHIHYNLIPGVVYTWPEVASVGATEQELKAVGKEIKIGKFPFRALGRSRASTDTEGFVKMIADQKTDEILGVHIVGARAADLISEAVTAMEFKASAEDIARISHAHPTYSEAVKEAALAATDNRPIHI